jgi:hypothetical protein
LLFPLPQFWANPQISMKLLESLYVTFMGSVLFLFDIKYVSIYFIYKCVYNMIYFYIVQIYVSYFIYKFHFEWCTHQIFFFLFSRHTGVWTKGLVLTGPCPQTFFL